MSEYNNVISSALITPVLFSIIPKIFTIIPKNTDYYQNSQNYSRIIPAGLNVTMF